MEQVFIISHIISDSIAISTHSLLGMVIALIATSHFEGSLATFGALSILGIFISPFVVVSCHKILAKGISLVAFSLVCVGITREQEEAEKQ
jgi:hypothetical protein